MRTESSAEPEFSSLLDSIIEKTPLAEFARRQGINSAIIKKSVLIVLVELKKQGFLVRIEPAEPKQPDQGSVASGTKQTLTKNLTDLKHLNTKQIRVREVFRRFKLLERKKLHEPLNKEEEHSWYICHNILMSSLFHQPYSALLDRRRNIRIPTGIKVDYRTLTQKWSDRLINIGMGGVCLPANNKLDRGKRIKVTLHLPSESRTFQCRVNLVSPEKNTMSVIFVSPSDEDKLALLSFINHEIERHLQL